MKTSMTARLIAAVCAAFVATLLLPDRGFAATPALTLVAPGTPGPVVVDTTAGWEFTIQVPTMLTHLGFFDAGLDGLAESHRIGVWNMAGVLLVDGTVSAGTNGSLVNEFRYVEVPHTLLAPGSYVIGARFANNPDLEAGGAASVITQPGISFVQPHYASAGGFSFPDVGQGVGNGFNHFGPNFLIEQTPCPCEGPLSGGVWKNHGQYVSCVAKAAEAAQQAGLISEDEKDALVEEAAQSNCGKKK